MRVDEVTAPLTVGQLAARAGVRADTIRYYEREGLLPVPQRTGGEHRRYGAADVDRMLFIRGAQRLGLPLGERGGALGGPGGPGPARASPPRACCSGTWPRSRRTSGGCPRCETSCAACCRPCRART